MEFSKLENLEAIGLIAIIMANKIILNLPKSIILGSGTSAWINVIYISLIALFIAYLVAKLFKNFPGFDILDVSNYLGKKFLKIPIGILYILFLLVTISLVLKNFSELLKIIYFNNSPIIFLTLFFIVIACIGNKFGIKVISKATLIVAPIVLLSILLLVLSTSQSFVLQRLFPIFGYGINETFISGTTNLFCFTGLAYLFLLKPFIKNEKDFTKISVISIIISGIYLLLSVVSLLASFSFILNTNENFSIYLLSRLAKYGNIIERANALFIFIWILSLASYVCITLFFILYVTKKLVNLSDTRSINYCYCSIILGTSLLIHNYSQYLTIFDKFFRYGVLIFLFGINILILILANIKFKSEEKANRKDQYSS